MLSFMDACMLWRRMPFPRSGSTRELVLAYGDLAGVDEHVTTVIGFVESGNFKPSQADVLGELPELMRRTERLADGATGADPEIARSQHAYAALLDLVHRQYLEAGGSPG
ncbi:hypothetical protein [Streptomyces sp. NPDC086777]|uniref:hypothetical protein n=1 Tax=Streptomyces sp. NPDC086777 TaxID=3154866 RepID=UPI00344F8110